ncbi:hypothetical protein JXA88_04180 [Candidatus Fermentibacteria bacterium]|nr:hypothetical protein [Candidatus Fermentibacteria bacterium]
MSDAQQVGGIDRRWVYLLVAVGALLPVLIPMGLPILTTPAVEALFQRVESFGPQDVLMLSFDYGPSSAPELDPMADAILRHCFTRGVRVVVLALFPLGGPNMAQGSLDRVTGEFSVEEGRDFVYLGYKDGAQAVMRRMAEDISAAFPRDHRGIPLKEIPLMQEVRGYPQIGVAVSLATGILGEYWANLVNAQFGQTVAVGATAVSAPKYYTYLKAGQMIGLLGGLKGAAEYEELLASAYPELRDRARVARRGMDVQSIVHLIIIVFILLGNVFYVLSRSERTRAGGRLGPR